MTRTAWTWAGGFGLAGLVDLGLTVHAHDTWHAQAGGPSVMTLGQLLGFVSSVVLLVAAVLILISGIRGQRR